MAKESVPLQYEEYLDFSKKYRKEALALEKQYEAMKKAGAFKTKNLDADADRIRLEHKVDDLKKTMENIDKDIYIQECFSIITDYLKTTKK